MKEELRLRIGKELKSKVEKRAKELSLPLSAYVRMILSKEVNK